MTPTVLVPSSCALYEESILAVATLSLLGLLSSVGTTLAITLSGLEARIPAEREQQITGFNVTDINS